MADDECGEAASAEAVQITDGAEDAQRLENGGNLFCGCRRDGAVPRCFQLLQPPIRPEKRSRSSTLPVSRSTANGRLTSPGRLLTAPLEDVVGAVGLVEFAARLALRQYSLASMMVRMRAVTAGSAGSGE